MATVRRRTAVLRLGGVAGGSELRALDVQRLYSYDLTIDARAVATGQFSSPLGDQAWRDLTAALNEAADTPTPQLTERRRAFETVKSAGRQMFFSLVQLHPALRAYLAESGPRRLVISSGSPELHALPWEALIDEQWRHLACTDLSIVHASDVFEPVSEPVQPPLTIAKIFGPGTERRTERSLDMILEKATTTRPHDPRVVLVDAAKAASIVHIEAHGDPRTGTIALEHLDFLDQQRSALLVLLWSCVSNLIQPWGESLAMKLHRQGNRFVLGFTTPLREDTAAALADDFYRCVFNGQPPSDPESVIARQRCRLYTEERLRACEWAVVSLWLRCAVDLDAAVLDGPRLPEGGWSPTPANEAAGALEEFVRKQLLRYAGGRVVVIPGVKLNAFASMSMAADYRGPALHLRHATWNDDLAACVNRVGVTPLSVHPADRLLAVIDGLATFPESLLLWSGVGQDAVDAARWLTNVPSSLTIVLVSPRLVDVPAGIVRGEAGTPDEEPATSVAQRDALSTLEDEEAAGKYASVVQQWDAVFASAARWDTDHQRRLHAVGYWSFIRLRKRAEAEARLNALDTLAPAEAALLRGNLASRDGRIDEAQRLYRAAEKLAAGNARDEGRALLELAYLAAPRRDGSAEILYREALSRLERAAEPDDGLWRSALGRALRDYADLLAGVENRLTEADVYLRRALMIHAIDGRMSQVVAALQTRGKIERARRCFAKADAAIGTAASLQHSFGNMSGWASAMQELVEVALEAGAPKRALALADAVLARLPADDRKRGQMAALAARACWQLGDLYAASAWANMALKRLHATGGDEQIDLSIIRDVVLSLGIGGEPTG